MVVGENENTSQDVLIESSGQATDHVQIPINTDNGQQKQDDAPVENGASQQNLLAHVERSDQVVVVPDAAHQVQAGGISRKPSKSSIGGQSITFGRASHLVGSLSDRRVRMHLTWYNVRYSVTLGRGKNAREKEILKGVSGEAKPGEMIAIMGGSGAGKTTMLNILAGRVTSGTITGDIRVNSVKRQSNWKRVIGYVEQDDLMYPNLTVKETLTFAAMLKLPNTLSEEEKSKRVEDVIMSLGLSHITDSRIGNGEHRGISGGERKRVSIGIEIVTDPRLIFLDEPTSGLDAFTAFNIVSTVKDIVVRDNRTCIMTIHQPRTNILRLFDRILLLSAGKIVFFGNLEQALAHFSACGFPCPEMENPADFFIDTITLDYRTAESEAEGRTRLELLWNAWTPIERTQLRCSTIIPPAIRASFAAGEDDVEKKAAVATPAPAELVPAADAEPALKPRKNAWPVSRAAEFKYLMERDARNQWRDRGTIKAYFSQTIIMILLVGFVFFRMPNDFSGVQNRIGLLFFIPTHIMFSLVTPLLSAFAVDRNLILRERYSSTYRVSTFFIAKFLTLLPLRLLITFVFAIAVYYMTGLRTDNYSHFLVYISLVSGTTIAAICMGLFIASSVRSVHAGQIAGSLFMVIFLMFSGNLANSTSITWILRWIQYTSIIFYGFEAFIQNELNGKTFDGVTGSFYLNEYALNQIPYAGCIGALLGLALLCLIGGYYTLRWRTRPKIMLV